MLLDIDGDQWGAIKLFSASSCTDYKVWLGPVFFTNHIETVFFPLQWIRACLSMDEANKVTLVVDGQLSGEKEYKREEDEKRPENISLVLGLKPTSGSKVEDTGNFAELNIFNSPLSSEGMIGQTTAGREEC